MNPMQLIRIEKVTLNIGTGKPGEDLEKAMRLLQKISNQKPVRTLSKFRIPTWGIRKGLEIGCKVTLRKQEAIQLLSRLLKAKKNSLSEKSFDTFGNVSFGIPEYLDVAGIEYDMSIGIIGFEVAITLTRPGFSIKKRRVKPRQVGVCHRITKQESIAFMQQTFQIKVEALA